MGGRLSNNANSYLSQGLNRKVGISSNAQLTSNENMEG